jgi:acyl-CoA thioesterase-1
VKWRLALVAAALVLRGATGVQAGPPDFSDQLSNPAMAPIEDNPRLPRVLLIGDSISIGYTLPVRNQLARKANVHRIPANGGPTTTGLTHLDAWLGTNHWDVIHFNWGLHDLKMMEQGRAQVPLERYQKNLDTLVTRLQQTGATLIWASTTPVPEGKLNPLRRPGDEVAYNRAAARVMEAHGVMINDLHRFVTRCSKKVQLPANVHFTKEGSALLAEPVVGAIARALGARKPDVRRTSPRTTPSGPLAK